MTPSELTTRYIHAVVRLLPAAERDDVAAELRTLVEDTLQERADATGRPVDEGMAVEVLRSFGEPEAMAERYGQPRRWLIGPSYMPAYLITLKVVAAVLIGLTAFGSVWSITTEHLPWADASRLFAAVSGLVTTLLVNLGLITLVFAVLERAHPLAVTSEWDPTELPAVDDPDRVDRTDRAVEICFTLVFWVLFGAYMRGNTQILAGWDVPLPFRPTPEFAAFVPWISLMFAASIALSALLLRRGRWNSWLRLGDVVLGLYSLLLFSQILAAGDLVISNGMSTVFKLGLAVVTVVTGFETAAQAWRLAKSVRGGAAPIGEGMSLV